MDGRRGRDGKVKQVEGLILLLMFYESYVESYLLTLTALEVQPWPESLHCVDILCLSIARTHPPYSASSHWGWDRQNGLGVRALHTKNIVQVPPQVYLRSKE